MDHLNVQQREAVEYDGGHLLIVAGPGTGKTHTITRKIFSLIATKNIQPNNIVAMTFTRKAGEELTRRLQKLLPAASRLPFAGTFHSFCLHIIRKTRPDLAVISKKEQAELLKSVKDDVRKYQKLLAERKLLDFDGILEETLKILRTDEALKRRLCGSIRYLFVDEYQDVNETQYHLIKELTGPVTKLCAIGDPDQAIYGFRGSDVGHFLAFERDFPGTRILQLEENYRSTSNIISCANELIEKNTQRVRKNLRSKSPEGPRISCVPCQTPLNEAIWIAKEINRLVGGTDMNDMGEARHHFADIAVMYRTNHQGKLIETALKKEGLPFHRLASTQWFNEERIVNTLLQLSFITAPGSTPPEYAGFMPQYQKLHENLQRQTPSLAVKNFLSDFSIENDNNILGLLNFATQFDEHTGAESLRKMLDELKLLQEHDAYDERAQVVTVMSVHASKGLEFPVVFIAGLEEGTFPYVPKNSEHDGASQLEEERRLLYVGVTRAKERLYLSYSKTKQEKAVERSRFIRDVVAHLVEIQPEKRSNRTLWRKKQLSIW